ncbi:MAG: hypothetical protein HY942_03745, partial [Gammaproteobacteria bacterium]|nr:hypothetical protein [Gammaproteobacteria bacterium]
MKVKIAGLLALCLVSSQSFGHGEVSVKTDKEKLSYSLGYQFGQNAKRNTLDLDPDVFAAAIKDVLADNK